jgi:hypothetical protein
MSKNFGRPLGRTPGRFWAIAPISYDEANEGSDSSPEKPCSPVASARPLSYLCRTPISRECDLQHGSSSSLQRKQRKRRVQKEMAIQFSLGKSISDLDCLTDHDHLDRRSNLRNMPVLPPSTFMLENFDAREWIMIQRKKNKMKASLASRRQRGQRGSWRLIGGSSTVSSSLSQRLLDPVSNFKANVVAWRCT